MTRVHRQRILAFMGVAIASLMLVLGWRLAVSVPAIAQSNTTLLVSAAASLKDVLQEMAPLYRQNQPNVNLTFNFGASGALQQQIEQGAPADIFISAARRQMDGLEQKGLLLSGTRSILANNRLVLIVPQGTRSVTSFYKLTDPAVRRIAMGEPRSVPAGQYAQQVLQKLGIYDQVRSKLVLANNVRQVLATVESGNADAGMVYATDARISNRVRVAVAADENYHSPIVYPIAVLKRSRNAQASRVFLRFLTSSQAKAVLRKYGFIVS